MAPGWAGHPSQRENLSPVLNSSRRTLRMARFSHARVLVSGALALPLCVTPGTCRHKRSGGAGCAGTRGELTAGVPAQCSISAASVPVVKARSFAHWARSHFNISTKAIKAGGALESPPMAMAIHGWLALRTNGRLGERSQAVQTRGFAKRALARRQRTLPPSDRPGPVT